MRYRVTIDVPVIVDLCSACNYLLRRLASVQSTCSWPQICTYVARPARDDVRPQSLLAMTSSASESDPGRAEHDYLTANRVDILVLNSAKCTCSKTGADDDSINS